MKKILSTIVAVCLVVTTLFISQPKTVKAAIDFEGAQEIELGEIIKFTYVKGEENPVYTFTTSENSVDAWYTILQEREAFVTHGFKIYDEEGTEVYEGSGSDERYVKLKADTQYWYEACCNGADDYKFVIKESEDETGETIDDAVDIKTNVPKTAYIQNKNDVDVYHFSCNTTKPTFVMKNINSYSLNYNVYDKDGIEIFENRMALGTAKSDTFQVEVPDKEGYIKVSKSVGKYILEVKGAPQKVTKITLNKKSATLKKGKKVQLKVTVKPSNAAKKAVSWKSSNSSVAKVSSTGKVTALKKGTATITCKAKDGSGKKATCKIRVR